MICMNYDHNKKFGLLQFYSGYAKKYFNSPKGYSRKIINVQTVPAPSVRHVSYLPAGVGLPPFQDVLGQGRRLQLVLVERQIVDHHRLTGRARELQVRLRGPRGLSVAQAHINTWVQVKNVRKKNLKL